MSEIFVPKVDNVLLASSKVLTSTGEQIKLGQLWQTKPAIFIFLRHFACIACRAHAKEVWERKNLYQKKGNLIFIGNGSAEFIDEFKKSLGMEESMVLTDPTLESFKAAGFRRGFFYVVQVPSVINSIKMAKKGHKQIPYTLKAGTHWQLGGILAVSTKGEVTYQYISESMGDFPEEPYFDTIVIDEKKTPSST